MVGGLTAGGFLSTYSYEIRPRLFKSGTQARPRAPDPWSTPVRGRAWAARVSSHLSGFVGGEGGWTWSTYLLTGTIAHEPRDVLRK